MVVLGLDGGLVVLLVGAGAGEEDLPVGGPADHVMVDELAAVIEVQSGDFERDLVDGVLQGGQDVQVQPHDFAAGQQVSVMLRPEAAIIDRDQGQFEGTVKRAMFLGSVLECVVDVPGVGEMMIDVPNPVAIS